MQLNRWLMNSKHAVMALLTIVMLSGLLFSMLIGFSNAQAGTQVSGIISSDTTWTKANSPYTFSGPVGIKSGVTLTIEAGVNVNFNGYYLQINGTLIAIGSSIDNINLNGKITFTSVSNGWDKQTNSGSIIENAWVDELSISGSSPKINNNYNVGQLTIDNASPIISNNRMTGKISISGLESQPAILNNTIPGIYIYSGSPIIFDNSITSSVDYNQNYAALIISQGSPIISNNVIISRVDVTEPHITLPSYRLVYPGIVVGQVSNASIVDNTIKGCSTGITIQNTKGTLTIGQNLIIDNRDIGINAKGNAIIQNNTIANSHIGLQQSSQPSALSAIVYNNFQNNTYNLYLASGVTNNVNATYNYWGAIDTKAINQSIYDFKNDFNLGTVNFTPFLTEPNPQATPNSNAPIPTPLPTEAPTPTITPTSTQSAMPIQSVTPLQSPQPTITATITNQPSTQPTNSVANNELILILVAVIVALAAIIAVLLIKIKKAKA